MKLIRNQFGFSLPEVGVSILAGAVVMLGSATFVQQMKQRANGVKLQIDFKNKMAILSKVLLDSDNCTSAIGGQAANANIDLAINLPAGVRIGNTAGSIQVGDNLADPNVGITLNVISIRLASDQIIGLQAGDEVHHSTLTLSAQIVNPNGSLGDTYTHDFKLIVKANNTAGLTGRTEACHAAGDIENEEACSPTTAEFGVEVGGANPPTKCRTQTFVVGSNTSTVGYDSTATFLTPVLIGGTQQVSHLLFNRTETGDPPGTLTRQGNATMCWNDGTGCFMGNTASAIKPMWKPGTCSWVTDPVVAPNTGVTVSCSTTKLRAGHQMTRIMDPPGPVVPWAAGNKILTVLPTSVRFESANPPVGYRVNIGVLCCEPSNYQ